MTQPQGSTLVHAPPKSKGGGHWNVWAVPQEGGNIVLVCDCPAWKFKHTDSDHRTCKHCAEYLGVTQIK